MHKALVRQGAHLNSEDVPTEPPQPGGLLIALEYVGICGTDLQILNGTRPDVAPVLGHEGIGMVTAAGEGAQLRVGTRVVFNPVAQLSSGRLLGHNVPGLFQQYLTVDAQAVDKGLVQPAQDCTPLICGALAEPLAAVMYGHELIRRIVPHLRSAVIFGAGPVGLLATQLLSMSGVRVFLVHPNSARLRRAVELALVSRRNALRTGPDLPRQILAHNEGERVDAALICTTRPGAPAALRDALEVVISGGCIDLMTNYPESAPAPGGLNTDALREVRAANVCGLPQEGAYLHADVWNRKIILTGHRGTSAAHLDQAMHELRCKAPTYRKLITHVLSLSQAAVAIPILASPGKRELNGTDCIKAVIDLQAV